MHRTPLWLPLCLPLLCAFQGPPLQGDPVWPLDPDPQELNENPEPGSKLFMEEISFTYVDQNGVPDPDISQWFNHTHGGDYDGDFAFADMTGEDDGDFDIVVSMGQEAVMAGKLEIDYPSKTGTITPIWFYLSNKQFDDSVAVQAHGTDPLTVPTTHGGAARNVLVYDFDGDNRNEVALQCLEYVGGVPKRYLVILQEDPSPGPSSYNYSVPEPKILARSTPGDQELHFQKRMGICHVSDDAYEIVMHDHDTFNDFVIWRFDGSSLAVVYKSSIGSNTTDSANAKTHEFNYVDIDGDGYDEFFLNGMIDFVDKDQYGVCFNLNGVNGVSKWSTGMPNNGAHMDQMMAADWDPTRDGLEIMALPEGSFTAPSFEGAPPVTYPNSWEIMYAAEDGEVLRVNDGAAMGAESGPTPDGQVVIGGNFTADTDTTVPSALEAMFVPKNLSTLFGFATSPPGEPERSGTYAIDFLFQELVMDGINFLTDGTTNNPYYSGLAPPGLLTTGPGRNEIRSMDWDGERSEDEIYCLAHRVLTVFRLGRKGDWGMDYPEFLPREDQLVTPGDVLVPFDIGGHDYYIHYYQGSPPYWYSGSGAAAHPEWAWNNDGPGRYTHYYEKLGHVWPHAKRFAASPWDVYGDHREEVVVLNATGLYVYLNDDSLAAPAKVSPHLLREYRRWRMEPVSFPFVWLDTPDLVSLDVHPADPNLPTRVVGMPKRNATLQLEAIATFSDGRTENVTHAVTWIPDSDTDAYLSLDDTGLVTAQNHRVSGRMRAELGGVTSNSVYVYSTSDEAPEILRAGYNESYIDEGNAANWPLRIEAYVAQKYNDPDLLVTLVTPGQVQPPPSPGIPETYWRPYSATVWLLDNGLAANGDVEAGDGIYSALISPAPQDSSSLDLGENLKFVQAAKIGATTVMSSVSFTGTPDFLKGNTWPSVSVGSGGAAITEPAPDAPTAIADDAAFWGPRVKACGTRGYGVDDDELLLEAEIIQALGSGPITVEAYLPWSSTTVPMIDQGNDIYTLLVDTSSVPDGEYLIDIQATLYYPVPGFYDYWPSDWCGRLYLHDAIPD